MPPASRRASDRPIVCRDANVFIGILSGRVDEEDKPGLFDALDLAERGRIHVVTHMNVYAEVIADDTDAPLGAVHAQLDEYFARPNFTLLPATPELIRQTADLRRQIIEAGCKPCPDATDSSYIAAALAFGAEAMHTLDGKLVKLTDCPPLKGLRIMKPASDEPSLGLLV